jgi:hypothetical protein
MTTKKVKPEHGVLRQGLQIRRLLMLGLKLSKSECTSIADNIVRLSVGIEDIEDLIADLGQAMAKVR